MPVGAAVSRARLVVEARAVQRRAPLASRWPSVGDLQPLERIHRASILDGSVAGTPA